MKKSRNESMEDEASGLSVDGFMKKKTMKEEAIANLPLRQLARPFLPSLPSERETLKDFLAHPFALFRNYD
jgi:hypothetical protein